VRKLIEEASELLRKAGVAEPVLELPRLPEHGELSCTSVFELAKVWKMSPFSAAERIVSQIDVRSARLISSVEAAQPGYINFRVNWDNFTPSVLREVLEQRDRYGFSSIGDGKTVLVEHTSVNPNKALHVGHARNVCLGDTLARLFKSLGYRTVVANYVDDSGSQMADIHVAFTKLGYSLQPPANLRFDEYCGNIYAEVNRRIETDDALAQEKRRIIAELEDTSSQTFRFNRQIVDRVLRDQLSTCWRLGARYDILNRESDIIAFDLWKETFKRLRSSGSMFLSEDGPRKGCWVLSLKEHPTLSREGDEILVKSDGVTTYVARDIAYAAWKLGLLPQDFTYSSWDKNPDGTPILITDINGTESFQLGKTWLSVNVIDVRQRRPQEVVKYGVSALGAESNRYIHYGYEVVSLSHRDAERLGAEVSGAAFAQMSGRAGIYLNAERVLNDIGRKASQEAAKRHADWDAEKLRDVGEKIAVAAFRYSLVRGDADKMIVFDSREALDLEGDTGPYIQYAYARATRIIQKAPLQETSTLPKTHAEAEKLLIRKIAQFPLVVEEAARLLLIKKIAAYIHELAAGFNDFYEKCPVISEDKETMRFRLAVVQAFRIVLSNAAQILGIPLLDEM